MVLIPGSGRSPGEGHGLSCPPVFSPGESHGQRSLVSHSPWGRKQMDTNKHALTAHKGRRTDSPNKTLDSDLKLPELQEDEFLLF